MATTLTSKGQVTIPKRIRDAMHLVPGAPVEFSVNGMPGAVATRPATVSMRFGVERMCTGGPMN
jgi:AbrB family looped-hinge helix DNA binding protein